MRIIDTIDYPATEADIDANCSAAMTLGRQLAPELGNGMASIALPSAYGNQVVVLSGSTTDALGTLDGALGEYAAQPLTHANIVSQIQALQ